MFTWKFLIDFGWVTILLMLFNCFFAVRKCGFSPWAVNFHIFHGGFNNSGATKNPMKPPKLPPIPEFQVFCAMVLFYKDCCLMILWKQKKHQLAKDYSCLTGISYRNQLDDSLKTESDCRGLDNTSSLESTWNLAKYPGWAIIVMWKMMLKDSFFETSESLI